MITLHFGGLLSGKGKQRSTLQVISVCRCRSLLPTTVIINLMQCDARLSFRSTQTFTYHTQSAVIIGFPRLYFGVGKTVFIGRLADPLDLR